MVRPQDLVMTYVHLDCYWYENQRSDQRTRVQWVSLTSQEQYNITRRITIVSNDSKAKKSPPLSYLLLFIGSRGITKDCYRYSFLNNRILRRLCEINSGFTKIFPLMLPCMRNYRPAWSQVRLDCLLPSAHLLVDTLAERFQVSATCLGITCHVTNANLLDNKFKTCF